MKAAVQGLGSSGLAGQLQGNSGSEHPYALPLAVKAAEAVFIQAKLWFVL